MRIRLLALGSAPPRWAQSAFEDYARRLPPACRLESALLPLARGHGTDAERAVGEEGHRLISLLGSRETVVALDERGEPWSTRELSARLESWLASGADVALLVGGPDGLAPECLRRADARWSLSRLTLPHALVRVIVAEQLYRAASFNAGHPYHRD